MGKSTPLHSHCCCGEIHQNVHMLICSGRRSLTKNTLATLLFTPFGARSFWFFFVRVIFGRRDETLRIRFVTRIRWELFFLLVGWPFYSLLAISPMVCISNCVCIRCTLWHFRWDAHKTTKHIRAVIPYIPTESSIYRFAFVFCSFFFLRILCCCLRMFFHT